MMLKRESHPLDLDLSEKMIQASPTTDESIPNPQGLPRPVNDDDLLVRVRQTSMPNIHEHQDFHGRQLCHRIFNGDVRVRVQLPYWVKTAGIFKLTGEVTKRHLQQSWGRLRDLGYVKQQGVEMPSADHYLNWLADKLHIPQTCSTIVNATREIGQITYAEMAVLIERDYNSAHPGEPVDPYNIKVGEFERMVRWSCEQGHDMLLGWLVFMAAQLPNQEWIDAITEYLCSMPGPRTKHAIEYYLATAAVTQTVLEHKGKTGKLMLLRDLPKIENPVPTESSPEIPTLLTLPATTPELHLGLPPRENQKDISDPAIDQSSHPIVRLFSCSLRRAEELAGHLREAQSAFVEYQTVSNQMGATTDIEAFTDAGLIESSLQTLNRTRKILARSGAAVGGILAEECQRPDGHECAFVKEQEEFRNCRPSQVNDLIAFAERALGAAILVAEQGRSTRTALTKVASQKQKYLMALGRTDEDTDAVMEKEFPCVDSDSLSRLHKNVQKLKVEFDSMFETARIGLESRLNAIERTESESVSSNSGQIDDQVAAIRRKLHMAEDFQVLEECRSQIDTLETLPRNVSAEEGLRNVIETASLLRENRADTFAFLDLCGALRSQGKPEVALLALLTRQDLYPADEISEDPDRAIGELVEAVCQIGNAKHNFREIWHAVSESPWLSAITRRDFVTTDLIERLAVMYVAEGAWGNDEHASVSLLNLGMSDCSDLALPPSVNAIIKAIVSRTPLQIASSTDALRKDELRQAVEERIAIENGKYRHIQCGKATHFARFEAVKVFPELEEFWSRVSSAITNEQHREAIDLVRSIDADKWFEQMNKSYDRDMQGHPHFTVKIRTFVAEFVDSVRDYVAECGRISQPGGVTIDVATLQHELANWGGRNAARQILVECIFQQPLAEKIRGTRHGAFDILLGSREIIESCPTAVAWSLSQRSTHPNQNFENCMIEDFGREWTHDEIDGILTKLGGWKHLRVLWGGKDQDRESDFAKKEDKERLDLSNFRSVVVEYKNGALVETFDACCNGGRFTAARGILSECQEHLANEASENLKEAKSRIENALNELEGLKDEAEEQSMPSDWVDRVFVQASEIERPLKQLQRSANKGDSLDSDRLHRMEEALGALELVVRECSNNFDAVRFRLDGGKFGSITPTGLGATEQEAYERCPDLLDAWSALRYSSADKVGSAWVTFAKLFGKLCNLYHDETNPKYRFVPVSSFDYPYSIYQTAFYKPKSVFLKRDVRFYLYRTDVDRQSLQRLDSWLLQEQSAAWLHIVFAPSGSNNLRKALQLDKKFRSVLVIDDEFLYRIAIEEKHDVPVRRGLHGAVSDLVSSSPFVANGYCHEVNNIYVGRDDVIRRLQNHPQSMIWGGRRIGKTSVLHALESILARRHYKVALVYADVHDSIDPDLAIAKRLADALELPPIKSVTEFARQVQAESKKGVKFAFLLDEVDEYIKKSRIVHEGKFPLASALRQIVMEDPSKETVLVYSGYHQLYFEAKLDKSKRRVSHPFVNIAYEYPIRDLAHDEVVELVKTGFEEMLGIDLHPDVPSLVAEKASRHPAFVQEFCRCLLDQVSRRRSHPLVKLVITPEDVEEVYKADGQGDGREPPFIFYVDETLGYNLSDLGRAIMLTISSNDYCAKQKIYDELCIYSQTMGIEDPRADQFSDTMELLTMTNLLTQDPNANDHYQITYPTFIDILGRLNKLGKTEIEKSLRGYDQNERSKGILR
jgi:hypothetical protein